MLVQGFANFADAMDVEPKTLLENSELLYVLLQLHISPEVLDFSALETQAEIPTFDFGTTIKFSKTDSRWPPPRPAPMCLCSVSKPELSRRCLLQA